MNGNFSEFPDSFHSNPAACVKHRFPEGIELFGSAPNHFGKRAHLNKRAAN